ncbi:MAG: Gfo/Idh/MocA family oxidoreductase [Microbacterium sp.]
MTTTRNAIRRAAIAGGGMVGRVHRQALSILGVPLVGVLGSDPVRGEALAHEWGAERSFASIEDLAASDVEVVHLCTPTGTHADYARLLIDAGKHVVCEKPLATTAADADELTAAAARQGVITAVPFVYRYYSAVREIRTRVQHGDLGPITLLHGSYLQDWLLDPLASNWRVDAATGGASRAFADIGSHWCDLIEWITGERFAALVAQLSTSVPERPVPSGLSFSGPAAEDTRRMRVDTEDIATLMLRTERGVPANLTVSQVSSGRKNRLWFEIDGASGAASFDHESPEQAWFGDAHGEVSIFARGSGRSHPTDRLPSGHPQGWDSAFTSFIADVYTAVGGEAPEGLPTFADGARAARLVDAVLASAADGQWKEIAG